MTDRINVTTMVLGPLETNVYIVSNTLTGECVIIDPAAKPKHITETIEGMDLKLRAVLLTHGHFDHMLAANEVAEHFKVKKYAFEEERGILADPNAVFGGHFEDKAVLEYEVIKDGDLLDFAGFKWKVIHTPGHTIGSCCYYIEEEKLLFCGDTLFRHGYGRCDFPTGDFKMMEHSLKAVLFKLPDDVEALPGHGAMTRLSIEKSDNQIYN